MSLLGDFVSNTEKLNPWRDKGPGALFVLAYVMVLVIALWVIFR